MPPAVAAGAGAVIKAILIRLLVSVAVNYAIGAISKAAAKKNLGGQPPVNVTLRGTIEFRRIVFGRRRVGGVFVYYGTTSTSPGASTKDRLWYVIALAGHQVCAIRDIWIDSEKIAN